MLILIKKAELKNLLNLSWRFLGANIILVIFGIGMAWRTDEAVKMIAANSLIIFSFVFQCERKRRGKIRMLKPYMIYGIILFVVYFAYYFYDLKLFALGLLQCTMSMLWSMKFADTTDVIK